MNNLTVNSTDPYASHKSIDYTQSDAIWNKRMDEAQQITNSAEREELIELIKEWRGKSAILERLILGEGADGGTTLLIYGLAIEGLRGIIKGQTTEMDNKFVKLPTPAATNARFEISQVVTQELIEKIDKENNSSRKVSVAYIPGGYGTEAFFLEKKEGENFGLTDTFDKMKLDIVDFEGPALEQAKKIAKELGADRNCSFSRQDALNLQMREKYDIINSNGLNAYLEPHQIDVLYGQFYKALKPGGYLVVSQLMKREEWTSVTHPEQVSPEWFALERIEKLLLTNLVKMRLKSFLSTEETKQQLEKAGFMFVDVRRDPANKFPTFVVQKPSKTCNFI